jgi:hypothetical protein
MLNIQCDQEESLNEHFIAFMELIEARRMNNSAVTKLFELVPDLDSIPKSARHKVLFYINVDL